MAVYAHEGELSEEPIPRRKKTAIEYLEEQALFVPFVLGDLMEHFGDALQKWTFAVEAARRGDLDRAQTHVIDAEIAIDIPCVSHGRSWFTC